MRKPKVMLLGLGFYGEIWLDALRQTDCCELAAVAGRRERLDKLSARYGLAEIAKYENYLEAIGRTEADIAIIVLPTRLHTEAARLALANGMHVLSEKPLTFDRNDAEDMLSCKRAYPQLKYVVNQNYRWRAHNQTLKKAIDDGLIGKVGALLCEFRRPENLIGYRTSLEMPLLQDVAIHHFDLIRFFTGRNGSDIYARSHRPTWSRFAGSPSTEAILRLEDGIVATYSGTWAGRGKPTLWDGRYTVQGERGILTLDETGVVTHFAAEDEPGVPVRGVEMPYAELESALRDLLRSMAENSVPENSLEDNFNSFAIACAAEQSVRSSAPATI